jgi:uncharacterized membrane protein
MTGEESDVAKNKKKTSSISDPARFFLLGALTGARSATPLAALALRYNEKTPAGTWRSWPMFRTPVGRASLLASAAGELIADKLPKTPSRIKSGPLLGRAVAGAVIGLAVGSGVKGAVKGQDARIEAAILGAAGAVVGSVAGYLGRRLLQALRFPDGFGAVAEDTLAIVGSARLVSES